jgi:hypothetical protein
MTMSEYDKQLLASLPYIPVVDLRPDSSKPESYNNFRKAMRRQSARYLVNRIRIARIMRMQQEKLVEQWQSLFENLSDRETLEAQRKESTIAEFNFLKEALKSEGF